MAPLDTLHGLQFHTRQWHPFRVGITRTLRTIERSDTETITRMQERRLRVLIDLAAHRSPFYRDWFRRNRLDPSSIRTIRDLSRLPLIGRDELVDRAERFCTYPRAAMWRARSSGTSGRVVTAYRTPGSSVYEISALERQWSWFGLPSGSRRVILRGNDFAADQDGPTRVVPGARQLLVSSYRLTPDMLPRILSAMYDFRPDVVEGWPSSIGLLATLLQEQGKRFPVRGIVTSSETTTVTQRKLMRDVFDGPIIDHYGQTERVAMAGSCEAGGFHVFPDYGITELLPVPEKPDCWEIVGTPLHNWGFPLFRYRTGDHVGTAPAEQCSCGRAFPLLGRLAGRSEDAFMAADGRPLPLPSTVIDGLIGLREVQIAQLSPGRFEVRVVPGRTYDAAQTEAEIRRKIDRYFGPGQHVDIVEMTAIPRLPSGKLKTSIVEGTRRELDRRPPTT